MITLPAGGGDRSVDYGVVTATPPPPSASLGDRVWTDADGDGRQDDEEVGVPGIGVILLTPNGTQARDTAGNLVPTQVTNAQGNYLFTSLPGGSYVVRFDTDCSVQPTLANNVPNDTRDSDATAAGQAFGRCLAVTGTINLAAGTSDITVDLGLVSKQCASC